MSRTVTLPTTFLLYKDTRRGATPNANAKRGGGGDCANDTITKGSNTIGNSPLCLWPNLRQHLSPLSMPTCVITAMLKGTHRCPPNPPVWGTCPRAPHAERVGGKQVPLGSKVAPTLVLFASFRTWRQGEGGWERSKFDLLNFL